ncbi:MAG: hypothetical protein KBT03_00135 [Bacteroidales bacterium]|nr:hypothetical protein [Candidatus Scybalousia scybalohippi]
MNNITRVRGGKIHKIDASFVISDEGGWLDGSYDSIESATLAIKNKSKNDWFFLVDLSRRVNRDEGRLITVIDIQESVNA